MTLNLRSWTVDVNQLALKIQPVSLYHNKFIHYRVVVSLQFLYRLDYKKKETTYIIKDFTRDFIKFMERNNAYYRCFLLYFIKIVMEF